MQLHFFTSLQTLLEAPYGDVVATIFSRQPTTSQKENHVTKTDGGARGGRREFLRAVHQHESSLECQGFNMQLHFFTSLQTLLEAPYGDVVATIFSRQPFNPSDP